ncbi:MAG: choice-of-anchor J domain-containing protein [Saprospiraceae bacterium]|nr:choice-of-anchor J domain-containing protein [Saprospiraceae bacterium]
MKKLLLLLFLASTFTIANAQVDIFYYEDFSNGMPADYSLYDVDGKSPYYTVFQGADSWIVLPSFADAAISTSYYSPAASSDDWMVTGGIDIPSASVPENKVLASWYGACTNSTYPDGYEVYISTTGNTVADFTTKIFTTANATVAGSTQSYDLSTYAGETIWLAFRNNSYDGDILLIDDILVGEFAPRDVAVVDITNRGYNPVGNVSLKTEVYNAGHETIASLELNYTIDNGTVVTATVSGLNIKPFTTGIVTHPTPWTADGGLHEVGMSVSMINAGDDANPANNDFNLETSIYESANTVSRKVMTETYTSSTCPPCQPGNANLHNILNGLTPAEYPVVLKWQQNFPGVGDPYCTDETVTRRDVYGINSIPDTRVDGNYWFGNTNNITKNNIVGGSSRAGLVEFDATYSVDEATQTVHIQGKLTPKTPTLYGTRLMMVIKEKKTTKNKKDNGETEFLDVVKKVINGLDGVDVGGLAIDEEFPFDVTYEFMGDYRLPVDGQAVNRIKHDVEHSVEDFNDLSVSLWLEYPRDEYVLNAADAELETVSTDAPVALSSFQIFPNPVSDQLQVNLELSENLDCSLMLYSSDGKAALPVFNGTLTQGSHKIGAAVGDLAAGTYFLHLRSAAGLSIQTVQINR